jgi:uncharacterized YccA/Bax inhibitor family protein
VLNRSAISFGVLVAAAVVGWQVPALLLPGLIVGFILAMVNSFKREPSPALILAYAAAEGATLGALSGLFESIPKYAGIVPEAVIATFAVVGVVLALFRFAGVRATAKANRIFFAALLGYLLYSFVNLILMWTGVNSDPWGLNGSVHLFGVPLGIILGVFAVLLGSYSLVQDFTFVENAVQNRVDKKYAWTASFGIMVTVVWLYVEILRLLAQSRR